MKKTKLLKAITNIAYYLYAFGVIITPIAAVIILFKLNTDGIIINEKKYTNVSLLTVLWGIVAYATSIGLFYCLFLFRKIIDLFLQLNIFHEDVIGLFQKIGKYLIIIGIVIFFIAFYFPEGYTFKTTSETGFSITKKFTNNFNLFLDFKWIAVIGVGLFFQVLGEIFKKAKDLQQENDLTI